MNAIDTNSTLLTNIYHQVENLMNSFCGIEY